MDTNYSFRITRFKEEEKEFRICKKKKKNKKNLIKLKN